MADLWIIEAPGKKELIARTLRQMRVTADVFATGGYLMEFGRGGIGISKSLDDVGRVPINRETIIKLVEAASQADNVVIATDADQAGDVIALDVFNFIKAKVKKSPIRVRPTGLDFDAITIALKNAGPIDPKMAAPGRARAIIDRILGYTWTSSSGSTGRTQASTLSTIKKLPQGFANVYTITVPCSDGGAPFYLQTTPDHQISQFWLERLLGADVRPVGIGDSQLCRMQAPHFGDILLNASDAGINHGTPRSIAEIGDMCQQLYISGLMSYPRSNVRGYSPYAIKKIQKHADFYGHDVIQDEKAIRSADQNTGHDAPYPLVRPAINNSPGLTTPNGLLSVIHQGAIRGSKLWPAETPNRHDLIDALIGAGIDSEIALAVSKRRWVRWHGAPPPGLENPRKSKMFTRSLDAAMLDVMLQRGIGRPGSWPELPGQIIEKGLVELKNGTLQLTTLGEKALATTPKFLQDPDFSMRVEELCETTAPGDGTAPWRDAVIAVMKSIPIDDQIHVKNMLNREAAPARPTDGQPSPVRQQTSAQPSYVAPTLADLGIDTTVFAPTPEPMIAPRRP